MNDLQSIQNDDNRLNLTSIWSEDDPPESPTLLTLNIAKQDRETVRRHLLGKSYLPEDASLLVFIEQDNTPLTVPSATRTVIGRIGINAFDKSVINLIPYGAMTKGVSRLHAVLHRSKYTIAIEDMESTNGTYVNGDLLHPHEAHVLHDGDELNLGSLVMRIIFH